MNWPIVIVKWMLRLIPGCLLFFNAQDAFAVLKTNLHSGNWSNPANWLPGGVPGGHDDVQILGGTTVTIDIHCNTKGLTILEGGTLTFIAGRRLTIIGNFTVNGTCTMNRGDITLVSPGSQFSLGPNGDFTWDPGTNDAENATLFLRGTERFSPTSRLIIRRWYNYAVALGSTVSGDFGNLTINTPGLAPGTIAEWNQNNWFQTRRVLGALTIDQGWVTLDKSGAIGTTSIGSIVLTSVNSIFYGHSGTHPGSFSLHTGNLTNNGGIFYLLLNGNGNANLRVSGNVFNLGNIKIIHNAGVAGVSNGNAGIYVHGTFTQQSGDTRFIYNISTTNSGTYTASFGNLILHGGIFFGQTGVHTSGETNRFDVLGQFSIQYTRSTDKFRSASLSSIGPVVNNAALVMKIGGDVQLSGPAAAEFTSSAAAGAETIQIAGNMILSGLTTNLNFGTTAAAHPVSLTIGGTMTVAGGTIFLSRNNGTIHAMIGNMSITEGQLNIKGGSGTGTIHITKQYTQRGGCTFFHNNETSGTTDPITVNVSGHFTHSGGTIQFENFSIPINSSHRLVLAGPSVNLSGTGSMIGTLPGTGEYLGKLVYARSGSMSYRMNGNGYTLQQVLQEVAPGCNLKLLNGPMILSSQATAGKRALWIRHGSRLEAGTQQIRSNGLQSYSLVYLDSAGTLTTGRSAGLFDFGSNGTVDGSHNLNFSLHPFSVVEYNGLTDQDLTGSAVTQGLTADQCYGILRIAMPAGKSAIARNSIIPVRTRLELERGNLVLDGNEILLSNGASNAITRNEGGIISENINGNSRGRIKKKNLQSGTHLFPFADEAGNYLPVRITPTSGFGADVVINTHHTSPDNRPLPGGIPVLATQGEMIAGQSTASMIDRWWEITANGLAANITLSYAGLENTLPSNQRSSALGITRWTGTNWTLPFGNGLNVTSGTGSISANQVASFGVFGISTKLQSALPEPIAFEAIPKGTEVRISWIIDTETNIDYFSIERSKDGEEFNPIQQIRSTGGSSSLLQYDAIDESPLPGTSFYRLRLTDFNGQSRLSEVRTVNLPIASTSSGIRIEQYGPNPFEESFHVNFSVNAKAEVQILLLESTGKTVMQEKIMAKPGLNIYEFSNGSRLAGGTYVLQISSSAESSKVKLIKK